MSTLRPRGVKVVLQGNSYEFLFTLNAIDSLQDATGLSLQACIKALTEPETVTHMLKTTARVLINDYLERTQENPEYITDKTVGWLINLENQGEVLVAILEAYGLSMPEPDEDAEEEEETDPNAQSNHQNSTSEGSWWLRFHRWGFKKKKSSE